MLTRYVRPTSAEDAVANALAQVGTGVYGLAKGAGIWAQSGLLPAHIKTWQQAMTIAMMADALQIPWLTGINHMFVVQGKVGCEAKLMLAQIRRSGLLQNFQLNGTKDRAVCMMHRLGDSEPRIETVTRQQADQAGWTTGWKDGKQVEKHAWKSMPDLMLQWRAISRNARFLFPDVVLGLYTYDEIDAPVRVASASGEVELDPEAAVEMSPKVAEEKPPEPPRLGGMPTDEQRAKIKEMLRQQYPDGERIITPPENKKWATELGRNLTEQFFADVAKNMESLIEARLELWNDKHAPGEADGKLL